MRRPVEMPPGPEMIHLDVQDEVCPEPRIKIMNAMQNSAEGQQIELLTDFPPAVLKLTNAAVKEDGTSASSAWARANGGCSSCGARQRHQGSIALIARQNASRALRSRPSSLATTSLRALAQ